jgi:hypothetical protein
LRNLQHRKAGCRTEKFVDVDQKYSVGEQACSLECLPVEVELKLGPAPPIKPKHDAVLV